jgi:hypothetical protein
MLRVGYEPTTPASEHALDRAANVIDPYTTFIVALQPFVGPWPLFFFQFLGPIHSR